MLVIQKADFGQCTNCLRGNMDGQVYEFSIGNTSHYGTGIHTLKVCEKCAEIIKNRFEAMLEELKEEAT